MKKVYLYIRLSDADDDIKFKTESESIANQRTLLCRFLKSHREFDGYEAVEFIDDGYSGTNGNRPAFERMIENLKNGEADVVICKDFSRFFRDYVEIGDYLERIFPFLGVRFIAVNDGYDSDDYKGTTAGMEVVMKYIVYAYYSRDLSMKVKTVKRAKKSKGQHMGQTYYGYMKDPDEKHGIIPNPDTAPVVRRIFDLAIEGRTVQEIAVILNDCHQETPSAYFKRTHPDSRRYHSASPEACWTVDNVRQILKRREYTGVMVLDQKIWRSLDNPHTTLQDESKWKIIPNCHEAIVSEADYEKAQKIFRKYGKTSEKQAHSYLLRGLVRCGVCGRTMKRRRCVSGNAYYCAKSSANKRTVCPVGEKFVEVELERIIKNDLLEKLYLLVQTDDRIQKSAAFARGTEENLSIRLEQIEKRLKQLSQSRVSAYERYAEGRMQRDAYLMEKEKLSAEAERLTAEKETLEKELLSLFQSRDHKFTDTADMARQALSAGELTNEMLLFFIDRVNVYSGMRVEIIYRFSDELTQVTEEETE